jgi:hypothetical protein
MEKIYVSVFLSTSRGWSGIGFSIYQPRHESLLFQVSSLNSLANKKKKNLLESQAVG